MIHAVLCSIFSGFVFDSIVNLFQKPALECWRCEWPAIQVWTRREVGRNILTPPYVMVWRDACGGASWAVWTPHGIRTNGLAPSLELARAAADDVASQSWKLT